MSAGRTSPAALLDPATPVSLLDDSVLSALPTPAYVYDLAETRRCYRLLTEHLPQPSGMLFALKANPHPEVVGALLREGCRAEVSSPGELAVALQAGARPAEILYTGPAKRDEDLRLALRAGVREFSVDSLVGVRQLAAAAREHGVVTRYLLRINPERVDSVAGLIMTGVPSQFGADEETVAADPKGFTAHPEAVLDGLHLYLGTNMPDTANLMAQFRVALTTALRLQELLGVPLNTLDLGGGFSAPYAQQGDVTVNTGLAEALGAELDAMFPGWRGASPQVVFESGRGLAATCGRLVTRVLDVKRSHGKTVVVVDTGIHHLGGMSGLRRVPPIRPAVLPVTGDSAAGKPAGEGSAGTDSAGAAESVRVCGPLCTPLDTWASDHRLGDVAAGDLLFVPNVGAYGLTASLALFLGHPMPAEVVVDGSRVLGATRLTTSRTEIDLTIPHR